MIGQIQPGMRCRTLTLVRTVKGDLPRGSEGTVIRAMENLGRHLILVQWDVGVTVPVFPHEIIMVEEQTAYSS